MKLGTIPIGFSTEEVLNNYDFRGMVEVIQWRQKQIKCGNVEMVGMDYSWRNLILKGKEDEDNLLKGAEELLRHLSLFIGIWEEKVGLNSLAQEEMIKMCILKGYGQVGDPEVEMGESTSLPL